MAEYWLPESDPNVIFIAEADSSQALFAGIAAWDDVLEMRVLPAVTVQEGLEMVEQVKEKVFVGKGSPVGA